jgi:hypothetical protein
MCNGRRRQQQQQQRMRGTNGTKKTTIRTYLRLQLRKQNLSSGSSLHLIWSPTGLSKVPTACAVWPLVFTTSSTDLFLPKTWFLWNRNHVKINIAPHTFWIQILPKKIKIPLNPVLIKIFPTTPKGTFQFLPNFQWKTHSILKNFCTASPSSMKPSWCTPPPPRELLKRDQEHTIWSIPIRWIS